MPNSKDIKLVALTMVSVMLAGYAMHALSDVGAVRDAQRGFGG